MPQPHESTNAGKKALIALGGNVTSRHGAPRETLVQGLAALSGGGVRLVAQSRLFATPCFPAGAGPDYVNAAALVETALSAADLLARLHEIEADFDRERVSRWAARTLDLDLIAYEDEIHPDAATLREWVSLPPEDQARRAPEGLVLPHPRLQDRAFVLVPAADVWPDWRHPLSGRTIAEMLAARPEAERAEVVALAEG